MPLASPSSIKSFSDVSDLSYDEWNSVVGRLSPFIADRHLNEPTLNDIVRHVTSYVTSITLLKQVC